jgi:hypothetical protein
MELWNPVRAVEKRYARIDASVTFTVSLGTEVSSCSGPVQHSYLESKVQMNGYPHNLAIILFPQVAPIIRVSSNVCPNP